MDTFKYDVILTTTDIKLLTPTRHRMGIYQTTVSNI